MYIDKEIVKSKSVAVTVHIFEKKMAIKFDILPLLIVVVKALKRFGKVSPIDGHDK